MAAILHGSSLRLLLTLAAHADQYGVAYPGYKLLTAEVGLQASEIIISLDDLEARGLVQVFRREGIDPVTLKRYQNTYMLSPWVYLCKKHPTLIGNFPAIPITIRIKVRINNKNQEEESKTKTKQGQGLPFEGESANASASASPRMSLMSNRLGQGEQVAPAAYSPQTTTRYVTAQPNSAQAHETGRSPMRFNTPPPPPEVPAAVVAVAVATEDYTVALPDERETRAEQMWAAVGKELSMANARQWATEYTAANVAAAVAALEEKRATVRSASGFLRDRLKRGAMGVAAIKTVPPVQTDRRVARDPNDFVIE